MLTLVWLRGLVLHRRARMAVTAAGIAVAVSLVASIGLFLAGSTASMTDRALSRVPLDWQVQAARGADPAALLKTVASYPGVRSALPVAYAQTSGYSAGKGGSTQSASSGLALGLPDSYRATYPGELRQFIGATSGVLIAQQMAANLAVTTGDSVTVARAGLAPVQVRVAGIVDLTVATQLLGSPSTAATTAAAPPPDNVMFLPLADWHTLFDPLAKTRPELVRYQVHAELDHRMLPHNPTAAFTTAQQRARNLETKLAGSGVVLNNLAQGLDKARGDSLYARIAFLFLGLPGVLVAALLTVMVAAAGADRRQSERALLRARGASAAVLVRLAVAETLLVGCLGGALGILVALLVGRGAFGSSSFGAGTGTSVGWIATALVGGIAIAALAIAIPAWRNARSVTVVAARATVGRPRAPWWARYGLDLVALALAVVIYRTVGASGYHLVLAVEGTPQVSVDYWSFAAPALAWLGAGLFTYRAADWLLRRGRGAVTLAVRPVAGDLAGTVVASMSRQRRGVARALTLVMLGVCFAGSTAAFNTTYRQQAEADARLTNGADVVVRLTPSAPAPSAASLSGIAGVQSVEPLQHRYAYIGNDLQDLYGVNATTVANTTHLQDAWFGGGTVKSLFAKLASTPNGVLLSEEVVHDYQLTLGDTVKLRVLDQRTRKPFAVPFKYIGITKEFPTAPKDAYIIVNASFVARVTGDAGVGSYLIQTNGASPSTVGRAVARQIGSAGAVSDIETNRKLISGSLTSVELNGLTRVELVYALVLVAAATGLLLWLGLSERRRTFAIAHALGATPKQLGAFVWSETGFVTIGGILLGGISATWLTWMLVKLLTGVFDPPPTRPAVPWAYLALLGAVACVAVVLASVAALRSLRRPALASLRDL